MADDVLINNAATIERCAARAHEEYARNIAVHDDQTLQLPITVSIITAHLEEFLQYSQAVLLRGGAQPGA